MLKKTKLLFGAGILSFAALSPLSVEATPQSGTFAPTIETNVVQILHRRFHRHYGCAVCGCACPSEWTSASDDRHYGRYDRSYSQGYEYDPRYFRSYYRDYDQMRPHYDSFSPYYDDERRLYYRTTYSREYKDDQPYYRVLIGK